MRVRHRKLMLVVGGAFWLVCLLLLALPGAGVLYAQSSVSSSFDHFTTGFRLEGAHRFADCEACHTDGMFVGTPTRCAACHTQASRVRATGQPSHHGLTTQNCESCHRDESWVPIARMDHLEAVGACVGCHNGQRANGKPPQHIPSSSQCDDCHRTTGWVPAAFDHIGIFDNCFSCHNGFVTSGKPPNHIPAPNTCEDCHNTLSWTP
ncbi:MAG: hypothetical protein QNJ73_04745 [Gammaproteobacteria bacterium]|nr:hypothetical protein [Gammaproteobacteria bacterium]